MGKAAVKIKIMPESPSVDLKNLEKEIEKAVSKNKGVQLKLEKHPVAFGLNSIIATFAWNEDSPTDDLEKSIKSIKGVSSIDIIDFRRAFG